MIAFFCNFQAHSPQLRIHYGSWFLGCATWSLKTNLARSFWTWKCTKFFIRIYHIIGRFLIASRSGWKDRYYSFGFLFQSLTLFLYKAVRADKNDASEPKFMLESSNFEMVNSKFAMVTISNVLMNITVLEHKFVEDTPVFFHLLKFVMNSLPTLQNAGI